MGEVSHSASTKEEWYVQFFGRFEEMSAHRCMYCLKDISEYNLDFTRDIVCGRCVQRLIGSPQMSYRTLLRRSQPQKVRHPYSVMGDMPTQEKSQCAYCGKWKDDWEITIDDSTVARYVCEECYEEK